MKRLISLIVFSALLLSLSGCSNQPASATAAQNTIPAITGGNPDSIQLDLFQGFAENLKLLHFNNSSEAKLRQMQDISTVVQGAEALDRDFSFFAYYPDYKLEITPWQAQGEEEAGTLTVIIDINGDYVDFYYPGPYPAASETIYRSPLSAEEFKSYIHKVYS